MTDRPNKKKFEPSRAARFPIRTSISYRPEGDGNWQVGETENISRSGVLFNSNELLEVNTALEMTFPLPTEIRSDPTTGRIEGGAVVLCRGRIVRTVLPPVSDSPGRMAATFSDYLMEKNGAVGDPENTA
jgi:PilZ domain-containing protein